MGGVQADNRALSPSSARHSWERDELAEPAELRLRPGELGELAVAELAQLGVSGTRETQTKPSQELHVCIVCIVEISNLY